MHIGIELRFEPDSKKRHTHRKNYFDQKGRENKKKLGTTDTDDDILNCVIDV